MRRYFPHREMLDSGRLARLVLNLVVMKCLALRNLAALETLHELYEAFPLIPLAESRLSPHYPM